MDVQSMLLFVGPLLGVVLGWWLRGTRQVAPAPAPALETTAAEGSANEIEELEKSRDEYKKRAGERQDTIVGLHGELEALRLIQSDRAKRTNERVEELELERDQARAEVALTSDKLAETRTLLTAAKDRFEARVRDIKVRMAESRKQVVAAQKELMVLGSTLASSEAHRMQNQRLIASLRDQLAQAQRESTIFKSAHHDVTIRRFGDIMRALETMHGEPLGPDPDSMEIPDAYQALYERAQVDLAGASQAIAELRGRIATLEREQVELALERDALERDMMTATIVGSSAASHLIPSSQPFPTPFDDEDDLGLGLEEDTSPSMQAPLGTTWSNLEVDELGLEEDTSPSIQVEAAPESELDLGSLTSEPEVVEKPKWRPPVELGDDVESDDLRKIKGIGKVTQRKLFAAGYRTWSQMAGWSDKDVEHVAKRLGIPASRIIRDDWVWQATMLVADVGGVEEE